MKFCNIRDTQIFDNTKFIIVNLLLVEDDLDQMAGQKKLIVFKYSEIRDDIFDIYRTKEKVLIIFNVSFDVSIDPSPIKTGLIWYNDLRHKLCLNFPLGPAPF